jgi:hypothetical protein
MLAIDISGIHVPDTRPLFLAALAAHLAASATAVVTGILAATARKRAGRHPRAGAVYLWALAAVFVTASVMAGMRWRYDAHLFAAVGVPGATDDVGVCPGSGSGRCRCRARRLSIGRVNAWASVWRIVGGVEVSGGGRGADGKAAACARTAS